jgi:hypothetical protein
MNQDSGTTSNFKFQQSFFKNIVLLKNNEKVISTLEVNQDRGPVLHVQLLMFFKISNFGETYLFYIIIN